MAVPDLSVVIPCFHDSHLLSRSIPLLRKALDQSGTSYEILLCDDGSQDGGITQSIADQWDCGFLPSSSNRGKGDAVRRGVLESKGSFIVFTDSDLPFGENSILRAWATFKNDRCQVVLGNRFQHSQEGRGIRGRVSRGYHQWLAPHISAPGWDTQCGLKGFEATVAKYLFTGLRVRRFAFDVEVLRRVRQWKLKVSHLPVSVQTESDSHVSLLRDGPVFLWDVSRILLYSARPRLQTKDVF